jgi:hypothetical protein
MVDLVVNHDGDSALQHEWPGRRPAPQHARSLSHPLPRPERGGVPGSSRPGTETDPAHAPPLGRRLLLARDERRFLKLNADKAKRRTLPTPLRFLGRLAMPNRDQVIPTGTDVGCESPVVGAAGGGDHRPRMFQPPYHALRFPERMFP